MPRYELNRLGSAEFENLAQALIKEIIGNGTITFGAGADGGREATFDGSAPFPSTTDQWQGKWIFQAKYHDTELLGTTKARSDLIADIDSELDKLVNKYNRRFNIYVAITNVPLSAVHRRGTIDKIMTKVFPKYRDRVDHLVIWGADDINRFLEKYPAVKNSYLHFISPGELIAKLLKRVDEEADELLVTLQAYLRKSIQRDQYAQLDQAGDVSEEPVRLQQVFFDLYGLIVLQRDAQSLATLQNHSYALSFARNYGAMKSHGVPVVPVMEFLLSDGADRVILVGGPGEGKSTVGQYLAQLHRVTLIGEVEGMAADQRYSPAMPRIPFRVILRDFGQWLSRIDEIESTDSSLEHFMCQDVRRVTARTLTPEQLHAIFRENPCLLILDGLDEVTDVDLKKRLLDRVEDFVDRADQVLKSDLQVVATTRPTGYNEEFNPESYVHVRLERLEADQVRDYVKRWTVARRLDEAKAERITNGIDECLADKQISLITNTPLQVTILVLIISTGGTPPRQREALFNEYLEVIYKREQAKSRNIISSKKELLIGLHKYIGYELHERVTQANATSAVFTREEYSDRVRKYLGQQDPYSPKVQREAEIKSITTEAGERLVLIVEPSVDTFGFELRSIQEFFAACHLCDTARDTTQRYQRFEAMVRLPHWRNVVLFFAGRVGRNFSGEASNIIEVCKAVDREGVDRYIKSGAKLALAIASDQAFLPDRRLQRSILEVAMQAFESRLTPLQLFSITQSLLELPNEDIRDHVVPILLERAEVLDSERVVSILTAIAVIFPACVRAVALLERLAIQPAFKVRAFSIAIQFAHYHAHAVEMARVIALDLSVVELGESLKSSSWSEPQEMVRVMQDAGASDEVSAKVLRASCPGLSFFLPQYVGGDQSPHVQIKLVDHKGGPLLICDSYRVVLSLRRGIRNARVALAVPLDKLSRARELIPHELIVGQFDGLVSKTPARIDGALAAPLWMLHLLLGDVTSSSLQGFRQYLGKYFDDEFTVLCMRTRVDMFNLLEYVVARWKSDGENAWSDIESSLLKYGGIAGAARWNELAEGIENARILLRKRGGRSYFLTGESIINSDPVRECVPSLSDGIDPLLLDSLAVGSNPASRWRVLSERDAKTVMAAIGSSSAITNAKYLMMLNLLQTTAKDDFLMRARAQTLQYLLDRVGDHLGNRILYFGAMSCISTGSISQTQRRRCLSKIGRISTNNAVVVSGVPYSRPFYEVLMTAAVDDPDEYVRRGSSRLLAYASSTRYYDRQVAQSNRRFAGFRKLQTALVNDGDVTSRAAGISLYVVSAPVGKAAEVTIRGAISRCESALEENSIIELLDYEFEVGARDDFWMTTIEPMVSMELYGNLGAVLADYVARLTERQNQSLKQSEDRLGLPIQDHL